ncbi:MAG: filamentous hemagglutinin N-terminal domain-containing protein [Verrucomicrobiota bacterium]
MKREIKYALTSIITLWVFAMPLLANPTGGQVVAGQATISQSGSQLDITTSDRAIINWQGFSISQGELTRFLQPGASSAVLNRVTSGNLSSIYGTLKANGQVYLINPNGIVVGSSGVIDTQGFTASTLDVSNSAFLSGGSMYFGGNSSAKVQNLGTIKGNQGDVFLISRQIENQGTIQGQNVGLAAGTEVLLKPTEGEIFVQAGIATDGIGIDNQGLIESTTAKLEAAGGNAYSLAINNGGVINATSVVKGKGGKVYLRSNGGKIANKGKLIAKQGNNGGEIEVTGGDIILYSSSELQADATTNGDGGKVKVIADNTAEFHGKISAKGAGTGKGGFAEVSGKHVNITGHADLTSPSGKYGQFLIDPGTVHIIHSATLLGGVDTFSDAWVTGQLNLGDLTIQTTTATGANGSQENILIFGTPDAGGAVNITWNANTKFELLAGQTIGVRPGVIIENTSTTHTGEAIVMKGNAAGLSAGTNATGIVIDGASIRSTTGDIRIEGQGGTDGSNNYGILVFQGGEIISNGTGSDAANIILNGTGGCISVFGPSSNYAIGVYVDHYNSKISTIDGDISITGKGNGSVIGNSGVVLSGGAQIISTGVGAGAGTINIIGTGGNGTYGNHGVIISGYSGNSAKVTSIDGAISITGQGGNGTDIFNHGVIVEAAGSVTSTGTTDTAATISIRGTGGSGTSWNYGVGANNNAIISSVRGDIYLEGQGGGNGTGEANAGVGIYNGAKVVSTGAGDDAADITIIGTGGNGTNWNVGVDIYNSGAQVSTNDGCISISGQGNGTGEWNAGVLARFGGQVISTGVDSSAGEISIIGTGGNGTHWNVGTAIWGDGASVTSNMGDVQISGQGGIGSEEYNLGVAIHHFAQVISNGTGDNAARIAITGTGGSGSIGNYGVCVSDSTTKISSKEGDVLITGQGGNSAGVNIGVVLQNGAQVESTGVGAGAASIALIGMGGNGYGSNSNYGVLLQNDGTNITTIDGDILITGQGGIDGSANLGFAMVSASKILSNGTTSDAGTITIIGTGGSGADFNAGIYIANVDPEIRSVMGDILLMGQGGSGTGSSHMGVCLGDPPQISSTGTGSDAANITIIGTGGNGINDNYGIYMPGKVQTVDGDILMIGQGNGTGANNMGIRILAGGQVLSTGAGSNAGTITLIGTGSANGTSGNTGVQIQDGTSKISSIDGAIAITGQGGVCATGTFNYGVMIANGSTVTSTGTTNTAATITIAGTGGSGESNNRGVEVSGVGSKVSSFAGNILIQGVGGLNTLAYSPGVHIYSGGLVESLGIGANAASITILGMGTVNSYGVNINGNGILGTGIASIDGNIFVGGMGAGDGGGVRLMNAGQIISTGVGAFAADIVIAGLGGAGAEGNHGVFLTDIGSGIHTVDGDVSITGLGGGNGTGINNYGIYLTYNAGISSTGEGSITLDGTGGNGTENSHGVHTRNSAYITSIDGDINLIGHGGQGYSCAGVYVGRGSTVESTGIGSNAANIFISGTGNSQNTGRNDGVLIWGIGEDSGLPGKVSAIDGDIVIHGRAGGGGYSYGVAMESSYVESTGTGSNAGNIEMKGTGGTGGTGSQSNHGILVRKTSISSIDGDINMNGRGGTGTTSGNRGISLENGGQVIASGDGDVNLYGKGGKNGTANNDGIYVGDAGSKVSVHDGNLTMKGVGGGSTTSNSDHGIQLTKGGVVESTGNGNILMSGTAGSGSGDNQVGVYINGTGGSGVTAQNGTIDIIGRGGSGNSSHGIMLTRGARVESFDNKNLKSTIQLQGFTNSPTSSGIYTVNGSNLIGGPSFGGYLTLTADTMELQDVTIQSSGILTVRPYNASTSIGLGNGAAGTLQLSDAELNTFADGFSQVYFGREGGSGVIHISNLIIKDPTTVRSYGAGGVIFVDSGANIVWDTANSLTLLAGQCIDIANGAVITNTSNGFLSSQKVIAMYANTYGASTGNFAGITHRGIINANTGMVQLYGTGGTSGSNNYGVVLMDDSQINSTGTGSNASIIVVRGVAGNGTHNNDGVLLQHASINTVDGSIYLRGTGNGSTYSNHGIRMDQSQVQATGSAVLTFLGTGGNGTDTNEGIYLNGSLISGYKNIKMDGWGRGTGANNHGITLHYGSDVQSLGTGVGAGNILIRGTGAGDTTSYGFFLAGTGTSVTSVDGDIDINGKGGTSIVPFVGYYYDDPTKISSTGSGVITLIGAP